LIFVLDWRNKDLNKILFIFKAILYFAHKHISKNKLNESTRANRAEPSLQAGSGSGRYASEPARAEPRAQAELWLSQILGLDEPAWFRYNPRLNMVGVAH